MLAAIAEADRRDPGWRFEDLEAARAPIPDGENSALVVQAAGAGIPVNWLAPVPPDAPGLEDRLHKVPLPHRPRDAENPASPICWPRSAPTAVGPSAAAGPVPSFRPRST